MQIDLIFLSTGVTALFVQMSILQSVKGALSLFASSKVHKLVSSKVHKFKFKDA